MNKSSVKNVTEAKANVSADILLLAFPEGKIVMGHTHSTSPTSTRMCALNDVTRNKKNYTIQWGSCRATEKQVEPANLFVALSGLQLNAPEQPEVRPTSKK